MSRYPGFYRGLLQSPSKEVRILARIVSCDPRSVTCRNLKYIRRLTSDPRAEDLTSWKIREKLPVQDIPDRECWRLGLMSVLLKGKCEKYQEVQDNKRISDMLDSLCST